jgi:hypothetical protein
VNYEARTIEVGPDRFVAVLDHDGDEDVVWVDWKLYSVANLDGDPVVFVGDCGPTWEFTEASLRASGHVKWDGCHEFTVEDYHGCEPADLRRFLQAIAAATCAAAKLLTQSEYEWKERDENSPAPV